MNLNPLAVSRTTRKTWCHLAIAWGIYIAACPLAWADAPATAAYSGMFDEWSVIAARAPVSPITPQQGDLTYSWKAPDGRTITTVVQVPHPQSDTMVTLPDVPEGADARPYFDEALNRMRATHAAILKIPPKTYVFQTQNTPARTHWLVQGLNDVTIDGTGATLVFTQNTAGLRIYSSRRLRITGLTLRYDMHTNSLARVEKQNGGVVLKIDPAYPVTAQDKIYSMSEYDPAARSWVQAGTGRIIQPNQPQPLFIGNQTYTSPYFTPDLLGKTFMVMHYWYGGTAIMIGDTPGQTEPEDVVLDGLTINAGPGMGIVGHSLKRGFAVINSRIEPQFGSYNLMSTNFDAINSFNVGGDIIIANNLITGQGDDAINVNNPVMPIRDQAADNTSFTATVYSNFLQSRDPLGFFDNMGRYLGQATVSASLPHQGGGRQIVLSKAFPPLGSAVIVRNLNHISTRYVVSGNTIAQCQCHGILAQLPNGLIENNLIQDTRYNAIRLMAGMGTFKEGVGAINVILRNNSVIRSGVDIFMRPQMPWSAISVYGPIENNQLTPYPVHANLVISGNTVEHAKQGCLTVTSSQNVHLEGNSCTDTHPAGGPFSTTAVFNAEKVTVTP